MASCLQRLPVAPEPPEHLVGEQPVDMHPKSKPDVNHGPWQRTSPANVTHEVASLRVTHLANARCPASPSVSDPGPSPYGWESSMVMPIPANAGQVLVHRSPPIAGSGRTRRRFCLDR